MAGCTSSECTGAACNGAGGGGGGAGIAGCSPFIDPNACIDTGDCPATDSASAGIEAVTSIATPELANPEIVAVVPGSQDRAVLISSAANQVSELYFTATTLSFGRQIVLDTRSDAANTTSVHVDPTGTFAVVTVQADDCAAGRILFVDIGEGFGGILAEVEVGYGPDSAAFSADGLTLVTADEDDREDHPCKPADRHGGSATIVDLSLGPTEPHVLQRIPIDHDLDSEPEGVAIASDGTVLLTVQETSEVVFFNLAEVPNATPQRVALPAGSEPDSVVMASSSLAVVGFEGSDSLALVDVPSRTMISQYRIAGSGDVPDLYNRDETDIVRIHEPEGLAVFHELGATFVGVALQESHAVLVYRLLSSNQLAFNSIAPAGIAWTNEQYGRSKSAIGPEGLSAHAPSGMLLSANEREGSVTLYRTAGTQWVGCGAP
jgi:DNA-binding beta-propeller fold protein YncE